MYRTEPIVWKDTLFADEKGNRAVVTTNNDIVVVNANNRKVNVREAQKFLRNFGVNSVVVGNKIFIESEGVYKIASRWSK